MVVTGRLSIRDEKEPQIVINRARPISDYAEGNRPPEPVQDVRERFRPDQKLYLRLPTQEGTLFPKIRAILNMFPGENQAVVYFADTKKRCGTRCMIAESMLRELNQVLGDGNVVIK